MLLEFYLLDGGPALFLAKLNQQQHKTSSMQKQQLRAYSRLVKQEQDQTHAKY